MDKGLDKVDFDRHFDSCHGKVSADQYHVAISRAQVKSSSRPVVFSRRLTWYGLDRSFKSGYNSGEEVESTFKFWRKSNPEAFCPRTQHNVLGKGSTPDHLIWSQAH